MKNIEKIIGYIIQNAEAECSAISQSANDECTRLRAEYFKNEQEEYWKAINNGGKETEQRLMQLNILASEEANKQITYLHREMLNEAALLAASKLRELPGGGYGALLAELGREPGTDAEELIKAYTEDLSESLVSALFD